MLSEQEKMLMVGFLDNQLSGPDRAQAESLLKKSTEAARLLASLKADAQALKQLQEPLVPHHLRQSIHLQMRKQTRLSRFSRMDQNWMQLASTMLVAATVLVLVVGVSFFTLGSLSPDEKAASVFAEGNKGVNPPVLKVAQEKPDSGLPISPKRIDESQAGALAKGVSDNGGKEFALKDNGGKGQSGPIGIQNKDGVLASPSQDRMDLMKMDAPFPLILRGDELQKASRRQFWNATLKGEKNVRLELITRDSVGMLRNLKVQLASAGFLAFSDVGTLRNIRTKSDKSLGGHIVCLEVDQPEEIAFLLDQEAVKKVLGKEAKASQAGVSLLEGVVVSKIMATDSKLVKSLVGVDLFDSKTDLRIVSGDPKNKNSKSALVLSFAPGQNLATSTEVKQFLEARKKSSPDNIRVLMVIRSEP